MSPHIGIENMTMNTLCFENCSTSSDYVGSTN